MVPFSNLYRPWSMFGGAPQSTYLQEGAFPDHSPPSPQDKTCKNKRSKHIKEMLISEYIRVMFSSSSEYANWNKN